MLEISADRTDRLLLQHVDYLALDMSIKLGLRFLRQSLLGNDFVVPQFFEKRLGLLFFVLREVVAA